MSGDETTSQPSGESSSDEEEQPSEEDSSDSEEQPAGKNCTDGEERPTEEDSSAREETTEEEAHSPEPDPAIRPVRRQPVGVAVPNTPADLAFLRYAKDHNLPVRFVQKNPKLGKSFYRYEQYKSAETLREVYSLLQEHDYHGKAWADIKWDYSRGYIEFPLNEPATEGHYVQAQAMVSAWRTSTTRSAALMAPNPTPCPTCFHQRELRAFAAEQMHKVMLQDAETGTMHTEPSTYKEAMAAPTHKGG